MIESLISWLIDLVSTLGYPGIAFAMFIESFFAPIPSELIMPFAGFLASQGQMNLLALALIGGFFSHLGSLPFYFLGYWGNDFIVNRFIAKFGKYLFISQTEVDRGFAFFDKHGNGIVLIGRVIPIIRTVISFPAGVAKMNFAEFSIYTLVGSVVWSGFLASAGYLLGENWETVAQWVADYQSVIAIVILVCVAVFVAYKLLSRRK
jgi:membrane protein DedA with SNARE-associated domain